MQHNFMLRNFFILLIVLCTGFTSSTQAQQLFKFGIKGGVNVLFPVAVSYSASSGYNSFLSNSLNSEGGFHVGGWGEFSLPLVSVLAEGLYSTQKYSLLNQSGAGQGTLNMNYIDVPILLKLKLIPFFNIVAGLQPSFLLKTKFEAGNNQLLSTFDTHGFNSVTVYGVAGAGLTLGSFQVQARYLLDINKQSNQQMSFRNNTMQISLAYRINGRR